MIDTQLSWLIPLLGGVYLLSVHLMLLLGQNDYLRPLFLNIFDKLARH